MCGAETLQNTDCSFGRELRLALVIVMIANIILGMGMVTSATYLIVATLLNPFLIKKGVLPLAGHSLIFYFAMISMITSSEGLASYASPWISKSTIGETSWLAFKMDIYGFLVSYIIIYNTKMILRRPLWNTIWGIFTTIVGIISLVEGTSIGYYFRQLSFAKRCALLVGSVLLIKPKIIIDPISLAIVKGIVVVQLREWQALIEIPIRRDKSAAVICQGKNENKNSFWLRVIF